MRSPESTADCTRVGETGTFACGWRYLVNDVSGRVVLAMDEARRVAGVYEYHSYGHVNRMNWWGDSSHPYSNNANQFVAAPSQPSRGLNEDMRFRFGVFDTETFGDYLRVFNSSGVKVAEYTGNHGYQLTAPWLSGTYFEMRLQSNAAVNATGVMLETVEYRRYAAGASPVTLRLRLPGQYWDEETDLFENWNRYYDAMTGRYLSPEPMLQEPHFVRLEAKAGHSVPTYAYGANNPVANTDPTGRFVRKDPCANWTAAVAIAMRWAGCKGGGTGAANPNNECQYQLAANGACNICKFLEDGIGPDAYIRSMPFGAGSGHTNVTGFYVMPSWHPESNSVLFDEDLCSSSPESLASIMIREASHYCATITKTGVPDGATSKPGTCAYFGDVCASNNGGPIKP